MKKIIVTEDNRNFREHLSRFLENKGYEVRSCEDGKKALELIDSEGSPDLLTTDINMPNMDGYDLMVELAKRGNTHPIIVCSSEFRCVPEYKGVTEFVFKDRYVGDNLIKKVEELIGPDKR